MLFLMVFERFPEKFSLGIPPNHGSVNMLFLMVFERFPEKFSLGISPPPCSLITGLILLFHIMSFV